MKLLSIGAVRACSTWNYGVRPSYRNENSIRRVSNASRIRLTYNLEYWTRSHHDTGLCKRPIQDIKTSPKGEINLHTEYRYLSPKENGLIKRRMTGLSWMGAPVNEWALASKTFNATCKLVRFLQFRGPVKERSPCYQVLKSPGLWKVNIRLDFQSKRTTCVLTSSWYPVVVTWQTLPKHHKMGKVICCEKWPLDLKGCGPSEKENSVPASQR